MSKMINFGIDLGTTNSLIAKFEKGQVEVFKNPNGFKESLPSVVAFRNDRILVGDQARPAALPCPIPRRTPACVPPTPTIMITPPPRSPMATPATA